MFWSQFPIGLLLLEQIMDDYLDTIGQNHNGFLVPHALGWSLVISPRRDGCCLTLASGVVNLLMPV